MILQLPENLPQPIDDGLANHLLGANLPNIFLNSTANETVAISCIKGFVVLYIYPMTGHPDKSLPYGWDEIPGARGCTPQSCSFRDHYLELHELNAQVFGLSTQTTGYQLEAKERLHLPFNLLSDADLSLKEYLKLPTFIVDNMELYKRITLVIKDGRICKVFYPVFPPNKNAEEVISWLSSNS